MQDLNLLQLVLLCCVLPFFVFLALTLYVVWRGLRFITPSLPVLQKRFDKLQQQNPNATTGQLVRKVVNQQAWRAGFMGAITSVGGLPFLPLGLALDLFTSARIQSTMLHFIAWAHGKQAESQVLDLRQGMVVRRLSNFVTPDRMVQATDNASGYVIQQIIRSVAEKSFAKLIPGFGLVIGFGVNYLAAQAMGRAADQYYQGRFDALIAQSQKFANDMSLQAQKLAESDSLARGQELGGKLGQLRDQYDQVRNGKGIRSRVEGGRQAINTAGDILGDGSKLVGDALKNVRRPRNNSELPGDADAGAADPDAPDAPDSSKIPPTSDNRPDDAQPSS